MQLIWVSSPTASVVTISITLRKVITGLCLMSVFFVALGFVFHFVGLRVALEYSPAIVHSLGGVTSKSELERMEAAYQAQVANLQSQVHSMLETVRGLEQHKRQMAELIGWDSGRQRLHGSLSGRWDGQGGPMHMLPFLSARPQALAEQLQTQAQDFQSLEQTLRSLKSNWAQEQQGLLDLPVSLPLAEPFGVSSGFGFRLDPFSRLPSLHQGLDFVAATGTPVQVTAPGVVSRSAYSGAYGQMVEVEHAQGYATRYAHLQERRVAVGDLLQRGDVVGTLGNSGRSTGPHLHYEILRYGHALHPARAFRGLSRS